MDVEGKDDVRSLNATDWPSHRHENNLNQRFSQTTRSVSISIPVSSIELNSIATSHVALLNKKNVLMYRDKRGKLWKRKRLEMITINWELMMKKKISTY